VSPSMFPGLILSRYARQPIKPYSVAGEKFKLKGTPNLMGLPVTFPPVTAPRPVTTISTLISGASAPMGPMKIFPAGRMSIVTCTSVPGMFLGTQLSVSAPEAPSGVQEAMISLLPSSRACQP
jgi:hypothetical protein